MLRPFVHINARHSLVSPAIAICRRCVEYDCQLTSDADVQITPLINIAKAIYDYILEKLYLFSVPRVLRLFRYSLHSLKTYLHHPHLETLCHPKKELSVQTR